LIGDEPGKTGMKHPSLPFVCWLAVACLAGLLLFPACNDDDDDEGDDDASPADDDLSPPTDHACVCCFQADDQVGTYCWNAYSEAECADGCAVLYDTAHLLATHFLADATCLEIGSDYCLN
jgi:hypothetical protein